jgi:hypothetical protein
MQAFNSDLPRLNEIIHSNNKTGIKYEVEPLEDIYNLKFNSYLNGEDQPMTGQKVWGIKTNPGKWEGEIEDINHASYYKNIPGISITNSGRGIFSDNVVREGSGAYKSINEYLKEKGLGRVKPGFNSQTIHSKGAWENYINKDKAVGYYGDPRTLYGIMKNLVGAGTAGKVLEETQKEQQTGGRKLKFKFNK